jgi:hypothetical protein
MAGCGAAGPVQVHVPGGHPSTNGCSGLLKALPANVMDQDSRTVSPDNVLAAAWGDPAIVLQCGVNAPRSLKPTSRCDVINGVGWFSRREPDHGWVFTTIGRASTVELRVPADYAPAADALVELAAAIRNNLRLIRPCV